MLAVVHPIQREEHTGQATRIISTNKTLTKKQNHHKHERKQGNAPCISNAIWCQWQLSQRIPSITKGGTVIRVKHSESAPQLLCHGNYPTASQTTRKGNNRNIAPIRRGKRFTLKQTVFTVRDPLL